MPKVPKIYVTKTGKKYFIINGQKIFFSLKLKKREVIAIHKFLSKSIPKQRKTVSPSHTTKASAVVNIHNEPTRSKSQRSTKKKAAESTIDPKFRVVSNSHPKDSGDKDVINSLTNKLNNFTQKPPDNPKPKPPDNPETPLMIDFSEEARIRALQQDPEYIRLSAYGALAPYHIKYFSHKYGLMIFIRSD